MSRTKKYKRATFVWKGAEFKTEANKVVSKLGTEIGGIYLDGLKEEVPVDEGNLKKSQRKGKATKKDSITTIQVGTDEELLLKSSATNRDKNGNTYDVSVYYPGRTRNYAGNDWIGRTDRRTKAPIDRAIKKAEKNINNIKL